MENQYILELSVILKYKKIIIFGSILHAKGRARINLSKPLFGRALREQELNFSCSTYFMHVPKTDLISIYDLWKAKSLMVILLYILAFVPVVAYSSIIEEGLPQKCDVVVAPSYIATDQFGLFAHKAFSIGDKQLAGLNRESSLPLGSLQVTSSLSVGQFGCSQVVNPYDVVELASNFDSFPTVQATQPLTENPVNSLTYAPYDSLNTSLWQNISEGYENPNYFYTGQQAPNNNTDPIPLGLLGIGFIGLAYLTQWKKHG